MLPERVLVKISSEAAGSVSLTPVVSQNMPLADLLDQILRATGKDAARIREILERGAVVAGASRFRWTPAPASLEEVAQALAAFPDSQPDRPFDAALCARAVLTGGRAPIEITRQAASRKGWFQKRTFWDALMEQAARLTPAYQHYSYTERADLYRAPLAGDAAGTLRQAAGLLRYEGIAAMVRDYAWDKLDLWVSRPGS